MDVYSKLETRKMIRKDTKNLIKPNLEKEFAEITSYHGFSQFYRSKTSSYRQNLWILLTLAATVACLIQSTRIIMHAFTYPTKISSKIRYKDNATFPAITICNVNLFQITKIDPLADSILKFLFPHNRRSINLSLSHLTPEHLNDIYGPYADLTDFVRIYGHQLENAIIDCRFRDEDCSNNFTEVMDPNFGRCFQFNAGQIYRTQHTTENSNGTFRSILIYRKICICLSSNLLILICISNSNFSSRF